MYVYVCLFTSILIRNYKQTSNNNSNTSQYKFTYKKLLLLLMIIVKHKYMATSRKVVEIISILVYFSSYLNSATVASSFFTTE